MSKGNMLLGYSRGKVGDVVFQRLKGQQITKARNRNPNNPRTYAQMGQRVRLGSCVDFYKRNNAFFPFAFQDKTEKESEYNAFTKANILNAPYMTKEQVTNGVVIPAPWVMTSGELNSYPLTFSKETEDTNYVAFYSFAANVITHEGLENFADNLSLILSEGQMLTFYMFCVDTIGTSQTYTRGYLQFTLSNGEIIERKDNDFISLEIGDIDEDDVCHGFNVMLTLPPSVAGDSLNARVGMCAVISEKNGSRILVSPSQVVLNPMALQDFFDHRTPYWLNYCCASYGEVSSALLDPDDASRLGAAIVPVSLSLTAPAIGGSLLPQDVPFSVTPENLTAAEAYIQFVYTFTVAASSSTAGYLAKYGTYHPSPSYKISVPQNCSKVEIEARVYSGTSTRNSDLLFKKNFTFTAS